MRNPEQFELFRVSLEAGWCQLRAPQMYRESSRAVPTHHLHSQQLPCLFKDKRTRSRALQWAPWHLPMLVHFIQDLAACLKECKAALQCLLLWMYQHCILITREQHIWFNRVLFSQSYPQPFLASSNLVILSCVQILVQCLSPPTFPHH